MSFEVIIVSSLDAGGKFARSEEDPRSHVSTPNKHHPVTHVRRHVLVTWLVGVTDSGTASRSAPTCDEADDRFGESRAIGFPGSLFRTTPHSRHSPDANRETTFIVDIVEPERGFAKRFPKLSVPETALTRMRQQHTHARSEKTRV